MSSITLLTAALPPAAAFAVGVIIAWVWQRAKSAVEMERASAEAGKALAELKERASRIPDLEAQIAASRQSEQALRDQVLRLSRTESEKAERLLFAEGQLQNLKADIAQVHGRLDSTSRELMAAKERVSAQAAELKAERDALQILRTERNSVNDQLLTAQEKAAELDKANARLTIQIEAERKQAAEQLQLLNEAKQVLGDHFKTLANDILDEKSRKFTEQNQTNLGQLLDPLRQKIGEFQSKVEDVYVNESKDRTALGEQVRQLMALNQTLSDDAKNLTQALKGSSKAQGNYGELILERLLESSGLRKGEEYVTQASQRREDGPRAQPDVIIKLPENRNLVVDSKVSLVAYDESVSAESDEERKLAIDRHISSVRAHIRELSSKNYQNLYQIRSLDCVLMFLPIEPAFMLAVTHDQQLFMEAWEKNVLLVSPSTLMFVVRVVGHLWRQEAQSRNAKEIASRGAELYDRLSAFVAELEKVGTHLNKAQESYTDAHNKLSRNKGNVIRQAQMLKALGVRPATSLPPSLVDVSDDSEESAG